MRFAFIMIRATEAFVDHDLESRALPAHFFPCLPMNTNSPILVCTDGSSYGEICLRYAAWAARRLDTRLEVLYVTDIRQFEVPLVADLSGTLGLQPYQDLLAQLQKLEDTKAEVIGQRSLAVLAEVGMPEDRIAFHHRTGLLVEMVGEFEEQGASLIMLGKRGERFEQAPEHLGASVERVVRSASKPCLVTSRAFREPRQVLFAYDGGPTCQRALQYLVENPCWNDLDLHLVHVASQPGETERSLLGEAASLLTKAGYKPRTHLVAHDRPEEAVARLVDERHIDLLIIGAYGHSRIRQLLIGSVTTTLLRTCRVPVLCFR